MANRGVFTEVIPKTRDAWYRLALMVESLPTVELIGELLDPYEIHSARFFFKAYITIPARTSAHYTKPGMAACIAKAIHPKPGVIVTSYREKLAPKVADRKLVATASDEDDTPAGPAWRPIELLYEGISINVNDDFRLPADHAAVCARLNVTPKSAAGRMAFKFMQHLIQKHFGFPGSAIASLYTHIAATHPAAPLTPADFHALVSGKAPADVLATLRVAYSTPNANSSSDVKCTAYHCQIVILPGKESELRARIDAIVADSVSTLTTARRLQLVAAAEQLLRDGEISYVGTTVVGVEARNDMSGGGTTLFDRVLQLVGCGYGRENKQFARFAHVAVTSAEPLSEDDTKALNEDHIDDSLGDPEDAEASEDLSELLRSLIKPDRDSRPWDARTGLAVIQDNATNPSFSVSRLPTLSHPDVLGRLSNAQVGAPVNDLAEVLQLWISASPTSPLLNVARGGQIIRQSLTIESQERVLASGAQLAGLPITFLFQSPPLYERLMVGTQLLAIQYHIASLFGTGNFSEVQPYAVRIVDVVTTPGSHQARDFPRTIADLACLASLPQRLESLFIADGDQVLVVSSAVAYKTFALDWTGTYRTRIPIGHGAHLFRIKDRLVAAVACFEPNRILHQGSPPCALFAWSLSAELAVRLSRVATGPEWASLDEAGKKRRLKKFNEANQAVLDLIQYYDYLSSLFNRHTSPNPIITSLPSPMQVVHVLPGRSAGSMDMPTLKVKAGNDALSSVRIATGFAIGKASDKDWPQVLSGSVMFSVEATATGASIRLRLGPTDGLKLEYDTPDGRDYFNTLKQGEIYRSMKFENGRFVEIVDWSRTLSTKNMEPFQRIVAAERQNNRMRNIAGVQSLLAGLESQQAERMAEIGRDEDELEHEEERLLELSKDTRFGH